MIDPSFQGVNRFFVLSYQDIRQRTSYKRYFFPTVEIKDYNVMIDGRHVFHQPVKNDLRTYETGKGDGYITDNFVDYPYFKEHYKLIAIHLSKQQALDANPKAIKQINNTLEMSIKMEIQQFFSLLKKRNKPFQIFTRNCESIVNLFCFNILSI